jgi:hypothetical protein
MELWRRWFGTSTSRIDELVDRVARFTAGSLRSTLTSQPEFRTVAESVGYIQAKSRRPATAALAIVLAGETPLSPAAEAEVLSRARRVVAETLAAEWQGAARVAIRRAA